MTCTSTVRPQCGSMYNIYLGFMVIYLCTSTLWFHVYVHPLRGSISISLSLTQVHHKCYCFIIICVLCIVTRWKVIIRCVLSRLIVFNHWSVWHTYVHPLCGSISMFVSPIQVHHIVIPLCVLYCIVSHSEK